MIKETYEMLVLKASEDKVLTNGEVYSSVGGAVYLGVADAEENWTEIDKSEVPESIDSVGVTQEIYDEIQSNDPIPAEHPEIELQSMIVPVDLSVRELAAKEYSNIASLPDSTEPAEPSNIRYTIVKENYDSELWTKEMVYVAFDKGYISYGQCAEILGVEVDEQ